MITTKFVVLLTAGTLAMLLPLLLCGKWYGVKLYKRFVIAILLTVTGTVGTYIMGMVENHLRFGPRSFYGAVFLIPCVFVLFAKLLRIRYGILMDMCAPSVCIMHVLMKVLCLLEGCCGGCVLYVDANGAYVTFPSQIVELIISAVILVILFVLCRNKKYEGQVYGWYLVIYGVLRFALNFFRHFRPPFVWILPSGHFWSIIAVVTGVIWLMVCRKRKINCGCNSEESEV